MSKLQIINRAHIYNVLLKKMISLNKCLWSTNTFIALLFDCKQIIQYAYPLSIWNKEVN